MTTMNAPTKKRKELISHFPSTWSDIDFSKLSDKEKLYWFENRRILPWLIEDTKKIKEMAGSMFGLALMVSAGVEFLSRFRYEKDKPNKYFPIFLEDYLSKQFKKEILQPYNPEQIENREKWFYKKQKIRYSEIFYFGIRNQLVHKFLLRHSVLIDHLPKLMKWEREKKRLIVDTRMLLICFENGVYKYLAQLWRAKKNTDIYRNFFSAFSTTFERKF